MRPHDLAINQGRMWLATVALFLLEQVRAVKLRGMELAIEMAQTIRVMFLKVATAVKVSARRVYLQLYKVEGMGGSESRDSGIIQIKDDTGQDRGRTKVFVHLNFAVALSEDGRLSYAPGTSCSLDFQRTHVLRETYGGIAVGASTFRKESPKLTVRRERLGREPIAQPVRIVVTRRGFSNPPPGYSVLHCPDGNLVTGLKTLSKQGIESLLVEGGPTLHREFLKQGLVDAATVFIRGATPEVALREFFKLIPELPRTFRQRRFGAGYLLHFDFVPAPRGVVPHTPVSCKLPTGFGECVQYGFEDPARGQEHAAYVFGDCSSDSIPPLVRLHSRCQTGDIFHSLRCDCGHQLSVALDQIRTEGRGIVMYFEQEGRGIGLRGKVQAYALQMKGHDTYAANHALGLPGDSRHFEFAAHMLKSLGIRRVRLLTTNPEKAQALTASGIEVVETVPIRGGVNATNANYLATKILSGHSAALMS